MKVLTEERYLRHKTEVSPRQVARHGLRYFSGKPRVSSLGVITVSSWKGMKVWGTINDRCNVNVDLKIDFFYKSIV